MKFIKSIFAVTLLTFSSIASADLCGIGRIVEITEGWGDNDHIQVKLDYSSLGSQQPPTDRILLPDEQDNDNTFWFRFNVTNLEADRLKRIRTLAYLALANGNTVKLISRWDGINSCINLSQLTIVSSLIGSDT